MLSNKDLPRGQGLYGQIYFGTIVDNNDPLKLGRVKVRLDSYGDNISTDLIPWSVILRDVSFGGGDNYGRFRVPKIGTYVAIQHINGDPNMPVCIGELNATPIQQVNEDYPNTYSDSDPNGNVITENLVQKIRTIIHNGIIKFNNEGNIEISINGDTTLNITGNVSANITGNLTSTVSGDSVSNINGNNTITCPTNTINGNVNINGNQTVSGNVDISGTMHAPNYDAHTHQYNPGPGGPTPSSPPDK